MHKSSELLLCFCFFSSDIILAVQVGLLLVNLTG